MNIFDAEPYLELLPRRVLRALTGVVLLIAVIWPTPFQRWYESQAREYAHHLVKQLLPVMAPPSPTPTRPATSTHRPGR